MLLFSLVLFFPALANGTPRPRVIVNGTTVSAGFSRVTGKPLMKCPNSHPYPMDNGLHCCKASLKASDTSLSSDGDCDGSRLRIASSLECCLDGMYTACPDQNRGCNTAPDICKPEPSIHPSTDEAAVTYAGSTTVLGPQKFLTFLQCEVAGSQSYYVARNSATNVAVVIDLGCQVTISQVLLRNLKHHPHNDRGTKDFTVEMSRDLIQWETLVDSALADMRGAGVDHCAIPTAKYDVLAYGRYVRFTAKTYYGLSPGLNFMTWKFEL